MTTTAHCHKCGAALDSSARAGVCSACLEKLGSALWLDAETIVAPRESGGGRSGRRFGDDEIIEEIARGGMGIVNRTSGFLRVTARATGALLRWAVLEAK